MGLVAASPIVLAAVSLVGDRWFPVGDLSHILFRVSQVGTTATPLVGAETIKGWAHPGPLEFYVAAPLYRLTSEDPRSLIWTASIVNVVAVGGIARVAWRRGGWPLLLAAATLVTVLLHSLGPESTTSIWNPFLPMLPWLLSVFLVWDAGLGNRKALLWAALSITFVAQTHLAFATLSGLLILWLAGWSLWWPRLLAPTQLVAPGDDAATGEPDKSEPTLPRPLLRGWWRPLWPGLAVVGVLWLPPLLDAVFDLHNPLNIAKSLVSPPATVGPIEAVGLVGRYVRPDGPWVSGAEPVEVFSVVGSGPLPVLLALVVLLGCLNVARRRGFVDVVALASLSLVLLVGAIPATGQIFLPAYSYLTAFLKLVGGLVWFTVAWTGWRLAAPHLQGRLLPWRRAAGAVAVATVLATAVWSWGAALDRPTPHEREEPAVQALRRDLAEALPRDERIRVEYRGDVLNVTGPGLVYWLIHDHFDVVTGDGAHGLKWGHARRWNRGEPYDQLLTVAVDNAFRQCDRASDARLLASYDGLSPEDRRWLDDVQLRRLGDPEAVTAAEVRRADALAEDDHRIGVFEGPRLCARNEEHDFTRTGDDSNLPVLAVGGGLLLAAAAARRWWRRRRPS